MEDYLKTGMAAKRLQKWKIRIRIASFKNMLKISYGLMVMKCENEMKFRHFSLKRIPGKNSVL